MTRTGINLDTWNRAHLFRMYLGTDFPYINIGCNLDVTGLYRFAREHQLSFYFSMIYAAVTAADGIENYRFRFQDGQPFVIDRNTAFATHMQPGSDIFVEVECEHSPSLSEFARVNRAKADIPAENSGLDAMTGRMDILNFTCIPWISYTHFIRTISKDGIDCNPKLSMGRFFTENGRILLPFSSQTHHGLMDGYHVGKFFLRLEEYLRDEGWS